MGDNYLFQVDDDSVHVEPSHFPMRADEQRAAMQHTGLRLTLCASMGPEMQSPMAKTLPDFAVVLKSLSVITFPLSSCTPAASKLRPLPKNAFRPASTAHKQEVDNNIAGAWPAMLHQSVPPEEVIKNLLA